MRKFFSNRLAAALLALPILAALAFALIPATKVSALQVDQTRIMNKRFDPDGYHPSYYRVTVNFNDPGIASGQAFGALGKNEFIKAIDCHVTTAFNAVSSNTITFGTTATSANEIVGSGITAGTPGIYHLTSAAGLGVAATSAADVTLYAKYAQTGTAATTGAVTCVIEFVPNNDM